MNISKQEIMRATSENSPWIIRTKKLTQALIVSGTLNVSLLGTFFYFVIKDKNDSLSKAVDH